MRRISWFAIIFTLLIYTQPANGWIHGMDEWEMASDAASMEDDLEYTGQKEDVRKMGLLEDMSDMVYRYINRYSDNSSVKRSLFYRLVPFFLALMVLFVLSIVSIMIVVFTVKKLRYSRTRKRSHIWNNYRDILVEYLNHNNEHDVPSFPGLDHQLHKKILIRQLYELANAIYGKKQLKLQELYERKNLHPYLTRKIRTGRWPIKAVYLKYLSIRPFREGSVKNIFRLTRSRNHQVRLYSQLAFISHHPDQAFAFLDGYDYTLSEWDQMNLYEAMIHNSIPIPDLYQYLHSDNVSVVVFALRLIRWYYVKAREPEVLLHFIHHANHQVRLEAYKTIVDLNIRGVEDIFRYHYLKESVAVKKVMIDYFERNKKLSKELYQEILELESDKEMLFYLLQSLHNQSFNSQEELHSILTETEDPAIQAMCRHIIENAY